MPDHPRIQRIHGYCGLCRASWSGVATVDNGRFTRLDPTPRTRPGRRSAPRGGRHRNWFITRND